MYSKVIVAHAGQASLFLSYRAGRMNHRMPA